MGIYWNMAKDFRQRHRVFVAMSETRPIAQPKNLIPQIYKRKGRGCTKS